MAITQRKKNTDIQLGNQERKYFIIRIIEGLQYKLRSYKKVKIKRNPSANRRDNNEAKEQIFEYLCV